MKEYLSIKGNTINDRLIYAVNLNRIFAFIQYDRALFLYFTGLIGIYPCVKVFNASSLSQSYIIHFYWYQYVFCCATGKVINMFIHIDRSFLKAILNFFCWLIKGIVKLPK